MIRGKQGAAILQILVFATMLAFLSSVLLRTIFSRALLFGETKGRQNAQKATEAAFFLLKGCLDEGWDGQAGTFNAAFTACQKPTLTIGGRQYNFEYAAATSADPYKITVKAVGAF